MQSNIGTVLKVQANIGKVLKVQYNIDAVLQVQSNVGTAFQVQWLGQGPVNTGVLTYSLRKRNCLLKMQCLVQTWYTITNAVFNPVAVQYYTEVFNPILVP